MKIFTLKILLFFVTLFSITNCKNNLSNTENQATSIIEKHGQLSVSGNQLLDKNNELVVLRGMSLFWSQWEPEYYSRETIKWLIEDWNVSIIRAAIGVEYGGYLENPQLELQKLKTVIDACIEFGIYVIVDWHDHHAENHIQEAVSFFDLVSSTYGNQPNIIYEIYNEPLNVSWQNVIKPYASAVIGAIRNNDEDNLIVVGTPNWSQDVDDIIENKIDDLNVAYTFHFYSSTHLEDLRNKAVQAISANIPLFVTEWGLSEANGSGVINYEESQQWINFLNDYNLSWCNWSIANKDETSAALLPTNNKISGWTEEELSESGNLIRNLLLELNNK